ncbi:MAG TPA: hypothetical protein PKA55_12365 [Rhodoblastus sp.]|nr:hypothetical protein [Rhodoblastus sp.]
MSDARKELLRKLVVGDIFHAGTRNGASLICLVTRVGDDQIEARVVTTQRIVEVDRATGLGVVVGPERVACVLDSVAPLPAEIHNEMLALDRKNRLAQTFDDVKLTNSEKNALLFIHDFYPERPIPGGY